MQATEKQLQEILGADSIVKNAPMREYTSFRTGGNADILAFPKNFDDLKKVISLLEDSGVTYMVMGNGTNVLVRDGGYRGVIVLLGEDLSEVKVEGNVVSARAGALLSVVAKKAQEAGLTGMEFASGIPGSIGGAVFMNAGAYGGEMKDIIKRAKILTREGCEVIYKTAEELEPAYRHSALMESRDIVLEVDLKLEFGDPKTIMEEMKDLTAKRNQKQPVNYPSAGSFFKRPKGYFAGKLIQDANLKGLTVGGAKISPLHSGFIINTGNATARDITELMRLTQGIVMDKFGVMLEPEVRIIGED